MRQKRFIPPSAETSPCLYHCVSRVVDRDFKFGPREKEVFVKMMRAYEEFCGVQVLAYCVMGNHFHVLVEVPPKVRDAAVSMSDELFLVKIKKLYSRAYYLDVRQMLELLREGGSDKAAEELKEKYTRRMHDLSFFMKGLKQRFTQWFNGHHGRRGTLWEGRFKSVLVESGYAARVMAAYIDLNPVRAGMVEEPGDYKWCSYGEAVGSENNGKARAGLCRVMQKHTASQQQRDDTGVGLPDWHGEVAGMYRVMLFSDGEEVFTDQRETGTGHKRVRKGFKRKQVERVLAGGGKLTLGETLRCKVRHLSDGVTFGSKSFVNEAFAQAREWFSGTRKDGARPIRGVGWRKKETRLYSMRSLRKDALG
ncbi:MAG: transposase [Akkermansiaceae bacterium]|nr:transposase [Akkermansiaceae bacterium]